MCLIFNQFPSTESAKAFAANVAARFGLANRVCASQAESEEGLRDYIEGRSDVLADVFPFVLDPPIVLVERMDDDAMEDEVEVAVEAFGGVFAGT